MAKKKLGAGLPPGKGGPPGGPKPDKAHPHTSGKPGQFAEGGDKQQDIARVAAEQVARVRAGKVDQQLVKLMKGYDPEEGYPHWAEEGKWEQSEAAVQPDGAGRKLDDPWLVVAHVYKAIGGKINQGAQPTDGKPRQPGEDQGGDDGSGDDEHEPGEE